MIAGHRHDVRISGLPCTYDDGESEYCCHAVDKASDTGLCDGYLIQIDNYCCAETELVGRCQTPPCLNSHGIPLDRDITNPISNINKDQDQESKIFSYTNKNLLKGSHTSSPFVSKLFD